MTRSHDCNSDFSVRHRIRHGTGVMCDEGVERRWETARRAGADELYQEMLRRERPRLEWKAPRRRREDELPREVPD